MERPVRSSSSWVVAPVLGAALAACSGSGSGSDALEILAISLGIFDGPPQSNVIIAGVKVNQPIVFRFNLPIDASTVNQGSIQIFESGSAPATVFAEGHFLVGPNPGLLAGANEVAFIPEVTYDSADPQGAELEFGFEFSQAYDVVVPAKGSGVLRAKSGVSLEKALQFGFSTGTDGPGNCVATTDPLTDIDQANPSIEAVQVFLLDTSNPANPVEMAECLGTVPACASLPCALPYWIRITFSEPLIACADSQTPSLNPLDQDPAAVLLSDSNGAGAGGETKVTALTMRLVTGRGHISFVPEEFPDLPKSYLLLRPTGTTALLPSGHFRVEVSSDLQDLLGRFLADCATTTPCVFLTDCGCVVTLASGTGCP